MRRLLRVMATLVVMSAAVVACSYEPTERTSETIPVMPPVRGELFAVGDSILVGALLYGDLSNDLRRVGIDADIVADEGEPTAWGIEQVEERSELPPIAVVVLGTNPTPALGEFESDVERLVDGLQTRGVQQVLWVPPVSSAGVRDYTAKADTLRAVFAADASVEVLDWDAEMLQHEEWFGDDGLHLTDEGYDELASAITEAVDQVAVDLYG